MNFTQLAAIEAGYAGCPIVQTIAPDDEMWPGGEPWYFSVGQDAMNNILAGLGRSRLEEVHHVLDLPCGHGRIARHLRAGFPDADLAFCDLNRSGVDFCTATFGGRGIYSQPELTDIAFETKYDIIWIGSLFTHVDYARAERWLNYLCACLNQDGILVATFHGVWSLEVHSNYCALIDQSQWDQVLTGFHDTGWGYSNYPGQPDFGVSLAKPSRILDLASGIPGIRIVGYNERGWAGNHDVLTLARTDRREPWPGQAIELSSDHSLAIELPRRRTAVRQFREMDVKDAMADPTTEAHLKKLASRVGNVLVELLALQSDLLRMVADADGIQARLVGFFSQAIAPRQRQLVTAYAPLSPGVHLGFEEGATVHLTVEPKTDFSLSPESCINTVTLSYSGGSRWCTIEAYCPWSDFAAAQRYQLGVYAVPNRTVACQALLRLQKKDGSLLDSQISVFELRPDERACNPSGGFTLPDTDTVDREQAPHLILMFDTTRDLEIRFDYISLCFA